MKEWTVKEFAVELARINRRSKPYQVASIYKMCHERPAKNGRYPAKLPDGYGWRKEGSEIRIYSIDIQQPSKQKRGKGNYHVPEDWFEQLQADREKSYESLQSLDLDRNNLDYVCLRHTLESWHQEAAVFIYVESLQGRASGRVQGRAQPVPQLNKGAELLEHLKDAYLTAIYQGSDTTISVTFRPDGNYAISAPLDQNSFEFVRRFPGSALTDMEQLYLLYWNDAISKPPEQRRRAKPSPHLPEQFVKEFLPWDEFNKRCKDCGRLLVDESVEAGRDFCPHPNNVKLSSLCEGRFTKWIKRMAANRSAGKNVTPQIFKKLEEIKSALSTTPGR